MPEEATIERARRDEEQGKSPSTQAGEFIREEMHHIREGKHGARSPQQAIAIGLSKARRAGVKLPPKKGTSSRIREQANREMRNARNSSSHRPSRTRSRATLRALKREEHSAASRSSLSRFARAAARKRGNRSRHQSAAKALRTKGKGGLQRAARKAARTRANHRRAA